MKNIITWDWRSYFSPSMLEWGRQDEKEGNFKDLRFDINGRWAMARTKDGNRVEISSVPTSYLQCVEYKPWEFRREAFLFGWGNSKDTRHSCTCQQGKSSGLCRHQASLMLRWEKVHGPFVFEETESEAAARREKERMEGLRLLQKQKSSVRRRVSDILTGLGIDGSGDYSFSPERIFGEALTNQYEAELAEAIIKETPETEAPLELCYDGEGRQELKTGLALSGQAVRMRLFKSGIRELSCSCGRCGRPAVSGVGSDRKDVFLCCHALAAAYYVCKRIEAEDPGDETDSKASELLSEVMGKEGPAGEEARPLSGIPDLVLTPRIVSEKNGTRPQLSFTIGRRDGRQYVVRSFDKLCEAVLGQKELELSKTAKVDFAQESFDDASQEWFGLINSRVEEVDSFNKRLERSYYNFPRLASGSGILLEGSMLDRIYDLAEGSEIESALGGKGSEKMLRVEPAMPKAYVQLLPVTGRDGSLRAVDVNGKVPVFLSGAVHKYLLNDEILGRVPGAELAGLKAFISMADKDGNFSCRIGTKKLAEFYYRVLPQWQSRENIIIDDKVGDLAAGVLPPEPQFAFYLDMDRSNISCRPLADYGSEQFVLGREHGAQKLRDSDQENRVLNSVRKFFPAFSKEADGYICPNTDEKLAAVLTEGVDELAHYGDVNGSEAFRAVRVCAPPAARISVQIDGGLLDLSVQTTDMDTDELLQLLNSYKLKKRWHRLKSGDYVDLQDAEELGEIQKLAEDLGVSEEDLIKGSVQLPKYRSLYVDGLLEEHDEIAADRDKNFKQLIRSFDAVEDSEIDPPEHLKEIMRPYQLYGFRWLAALAHAGFGGILADEMGLGKTMQMLAFMEHQKHEGEKKPSLVVCPASLVYNWKEEAQRFAPGLSVELLAGNQQARKPILEKMAGEDHADLYVTSYDTLKRDITSYKDVQLADVVLDEAQFIKNRSTAAAKAVKVLNAENRFALTGTPIENRLSELWSIFDFLMPGFLYTAQEFASRFETPIMKQHDEEASQKLSDMTSPFILRRKKADVLKDLPEKLEETQSQAMEEDQRKLYDAQVVRTKELLEGSGTDEQDKMRILAEITRLRQLCCDPSLLFEDYEGSSTKRLACKELVQRAIEEGHRMLIFSQFTSMLDLLAKDLDAEGIRYYTLTGATPKAERLRLVNEFNSGDVPVFLISLRAGGTGLNLTGADLVVHYDPWWNLAVQDQATDRAHRIGQTRDVTVIKLITTDTIEERIQKLQDTKQDLADAVLGSGGKSLMSLSREELMSLIG